MNTMPRSLPTIATSTSKTSSADACLVSDLVRQRAQALTKLLGATGLDADSFGERAILLDVAIASTPATSAAGRLAQIELARLLADQQEEAGDGDDRVMGLLRVLADYAAEGLADGPARRG